MAGGYWGRAPRRPRKRWDDSLSQMDPFEFEALVADYYRRQGYRVEHRGPGGKKGRFDGGIDLKMYRDDECIVVQCKRYTSSIVTHNPVHELLGVMQTEGATGAIFINSGEYTDYALKKFHGMSNFQLVDGAQLREMIGTGSGQVEGLRNPVTSDSPSRSRRVEKQRRLSKEAGDRLAKLGLAYQDVPLWQTEEFGVLLKIVAFIIVLLVLIRCSNSLSSPSTRIPAEAQRNGVEHRRGSTPVVVDRAPIDDAQAGPSTIRKSELQPGERCIGKEKFRRLPNGWEQIGSC